jgi:hypothetical protein
MLIRTEIDEMGPPARRTEQATAPSVGATEQPLQSVMVQPEQGERPSPRISG